MNYADLTAGQRLRLRMLADSAVDGHCLKLVYWFGNLAPLVLAEVHLDPGIKYYEQALSSIARHPGLARWVRHGGHDAQAVINSVNPKEKQHAIGMSPTPALGEGRLAVAGAKVHGDLGGHG